MGGGIRVENIGGHVVMVEGGVTEAIGGCTGMECCWTAAWCSYVCNGCLCSCTVGHVYSVGVEGGQGALGDNWVYGINYRVFLISSGVAPFPKLASRIMTISHF